MDRGTRAEAGARAGPLTATMPETDTVPPANSEPTPTVPRPGATVRPITTRKAAFLGVGSTGISALLGIVNALLMASYFSVSRPVDAYLVALNVPQLLGAILGIRLSVFLVPWLISYRHAYGSARLRQMQWRLVLICPAVAAVLLFGMYLAAWPLVELLAPGFRPEDQLLVIKLLRLTFPGGVCMVLLAMLTSIAYAHQRFSGIALATLLNPAATLVLLLVLGRSYGVTTLAAGFLLGQLLGIIPVVFSMRDVWFDSSTDASPPPVAREVPAFEGIFVLGLLTTLHNHLPLLLARNLASNMEEGVIAALQYASQFSWMPITILATSVGSALLPSLAERYHATRHQPDAQPLYDAARAMRVLAYVLIPLAVALTLFAFPIISYALARGRFDKTAVYLTSEAIKWYGPLLWIGAVWAILLKVVQARNNLRVLFEALVLGTVLDIGCMLLLSPVMGYKAIPIGGSANYLAVTFYILARTYRTLPLPRREIAVSMGVLTVVAVAAGAAAWLVQPHTPAPLTGLIYMGVYLGLAWLLKLREQQEFVSLLSSRARRRGPVAS